LGSGTVGLCRSVGRFSGPLTGIDCLFIGGRYLSIQIANRLLMFGSLLLQIADLALGLIDLVLYRGDSFANVLLSRTASAQNGQHGQCAKGRRIAECHTKVSFFSI
jgi:hypothetical protein